MNAADAALDDPVARWVALVTAVGAIVLGVLYLIVKLRGLAADLGLVKSEVKNDHTTNLREEADERHDENTSALARIERKVDEALVQLGVHEYRLNELSEDVENTRDRRPGP